MRGITTCSVKTPSYDVKKLIPYRPGGADHDKMKAMKILAIAGRPPKTPILKTLQHHADVSAILALGDLDYLSLSELEKITTIPKLGVYGNHCSKTYFENLGIVNMHLKTQEIQGVFWWF